MCIGNDSIVKAKIGSWITLAEYHYNRDAITVKSEQVDGVRIKEDTWYRLVNGKFKKVNVM